MGSSEKKRRREVNRVLADYSFAYAGQKLPLKSSKSASDMLVEFSLPLLRVIPDLRTAIAIGVVSWNASLAPEKERPSLIDRFAGALFAEKPAAESTVRTLIEAMIERRIQFYRDESIYYLPNQKLESAP